MINLGLILSLQLSSDFSTLVYTLMPPQEQLSCLGWDQGLPFLQDVYFHVPKDTDFNVSRSRIHS